MEDRDSTFAGHGLEVPNLHSLKSYNIAITTTIFQKLNLKNEVSSILDSEELKISKICTIHCDTWDYLESIKLKSLGEPKFQNIQCFLCCGISNYAVIGLLSYALHPCKSPVSVFITLVRFLLAVL